MQLFREAACVPFSIFRFSNHGLGRLQVLLWKISTTTVTFALTGSKTTGQSICPASFLVFDNEAGALVIKELLRFLDLPDEIRKKAYKNVFKRAGLRLLSPGDGKRSWEHGPANEQSHP